MKRKHFIIALLAMLWSFSLSVNAQTASFDGEGTSDSPFIVDGLDDLKAFRDAVNGGEGYSGQYFKLENDITLTDEWAPIGNGTRSSKIYSGNSFKGTFDGGGKTISGLKIISTTGADAAIGLFGVVDGGTVKNVNLTGVDINVANSDLAGAAIGMMLNGATAEDITVSGAIVGNDGVGGIVGRLIINGTIKNCTNNASVTSSYGGIGGIVGKAYYEDGANTSTFASIEACTNTGTITAPMYVGGIVGLARANVTNCVNEGAVVGGTQTGGIVGQLIAAGTVSGNENKAKISGKNHLGGIIGDYSQSSDYTYYNVLIANNTNRGELAATEQCAAIMGCNNIDDFTAMTASGNKSYYYVDGLELFGNPEDMVIDDTNKFATAAVAKIGDVEYATLEEAFAAAAEATEAITITLLEDITIESDLSNAGKGYFNVADGKNVTLNLGGKKITVADKSAGNFIIFYNYGEFTIKNGIVELTATNDRDWNAQSTIVLNRGGIFNCESGTYTHNGGTDMAFVFDNSGNYYGDATMNINGGELFSSYTAIRNRMEQNSHGASGKAILNVSGGKIDGTTSAIWAQAASTSEEAPATGAINVSGGEVGAINTARSTGAECMTTITGGTVTAFKGEVGELTVKGGTITGDVTILTATGEATDYAITADGVYAQAVAQVGEVKYTDIQEAIKAAAPAGTVDVLADIIVDKWVMFAEKMTIGDGSLITLNINGLTINGNNKTMTVKSIESASNGGYLFYDAQNLTVIDLTINIADGYVGGIGLQQGTISNVTFQGGQYAVLPGKNGVTIEGCEFLDTESYAIYYEDERPGIVVTGNTFNTADGKYAITMRSNEQFTNNTIVTGRVNLANSATSTVTGNDFGTERFKVYNGAKATISGNEINNLVFNDESVVNSKFGENTLSAEAQAVLDNATFPTPVAKIGDVEYTTLQEALDAAAAGTGNVTVTILDNVNLTGVTWNPVTVSDPGYPVVTVEGNDKTITGLTDMLFAGTWAGGSGLIIKNLTIENSAIVNDKDDAKGTVGVGAFIGYPQASATITLENCHLKNSSVEGGHWTGGLIGMAGGYNGTDGPVFMNLTIKGCSVTGSTITGKGSVGGIIGHGSCSAWTNVAIEETTVSGNTITSTGDSNVKAGAVMGTIGAAGQPTTANGVTKTGGASVSATVSDNTVKSNGTEITTIYGRQGTETGMLYVAGGSYDKYPIEEGVAYAAPAEGYKIVENTDGTFGVQEDPAYGKVAKIGDAEYATLAKAVEAATAGETITMIADVELTETVTVPAGANITLDLNGKTISMSDESGATAALIKNNGTLTIDDSSEAKDGKLTFNSTTPSADNAYASNVISNYGTITIKAGTVENTTIGGACYALDNYAGSNATIEGGKLSAEKTTVRIFNWTNGDAAKATLNVNGGEIYSKDGYAINVNSGNAPSVALNITGGTITTDDTDYNLAVYVVNKGNAENFTANVTGGTFNGNFALNGITSTTMKENAVSISGGTFDGVICYEEPAYGFISGGTFGEDVADFCAEGFTCEANADGTYGIVEKPAEPVRPEYIEITINEFGKGTYCSEWVLDFDNVEGDDDAFKAYAATGYNPTSGVLTMTRQNTARAKTGLFIKGTPGATYKIPTLESTDDFTMNMLVGTLEKTMLTQVSDGYVNFIYTLNDENKLVFKRANPDGTNYSDVNRAYLRIPEDWYLSTSSAKGIKAVFDDEETTGINEIEINGLDGTVYDLQGRRVINPAKGMYIINGKKVFIK